MTARDDNPNLHRIEVTHDKLGQVESVRFVCAGDEAAPCHHWPACDCEAWGDDHYAEPYDRHEPNKQRAANPGHEDVQQDVCWIDPWFNDAIGSSPGDWEEAYDGDDEIRVMDSDNEDPWAWIVSGPISVTFEGEYMTWEYAAVEA